MLEKIKYINHVNEVLEFGQDGLFANESDLRDYKWDSVSANDRISEFTKGIVNKTIPVFIRCDTESEGIALKNRLFEVIEKDVLVAQHGKMIVGDYYCKCFLNGSSKDKYLVDKRLLKTTLKMTTDFPSWIKETTVVFRPTTSSGESVQTRSGIVTGKRNFDYNFDFPYDYTSEMLNKNLNNTGFVASAFKLIIYGTCVNPVIHIGGHTYQVNVEVGENEYLTVDSLSKTIILTHYDGTEENVFNARNKNSYIFQKIPSGQNIVTWDGYYGFDVILYEERSEPKWI